MGYIRHTRGRYCLPFWPHPEYAKLCATDAWPGNVPERIALADFLEWLSDLESKQVSVAVFPRPDGKGVIVSAGKLRQHLLEECQQYE